MLSATGELLGAEAADLADEFLGSPAPAPPVVEMTAMEIGEPPKEPEPEESSAAVAEGEVEDRGEVETQAQELERGMRTMAGNNLVWRFCAYGFLKNLQFFEPYMWVVLYSWGLSLTQIGLLVSVEKVRLAAQPLRQHRKQRRCFRLERASVLEQASTAPQAKGGVLD